MKEIQLKLNDTESEMEVIHLLTLLNESESVKVTKDSGYTILQRKNFELLTGTTVDFSMNQGEIRRFMALLACVQANYDCQKTDKST